MIIIIFWFDRCHKLLLNGCVNLRLKRFKMNIKYNKATLLILFLLSSHILLAQENIFMVSGQYRVEGELRHGFRTLATDSSKAAFLFHKGPAWF